MAQPTYSKLEFTSSKYSSTVQISALSRLPCSNCCWHNIVISARIRFSFIELKGTSGGETSSAKKTPDGTGGCRNSSWTPSSRSSERRNTKHHFIFKWRGKKPHKKNNLAPHWFAKLGWAQGWVKSLYTSEIRSQEAQVPKLWKVTTPTGITFGHWWRFWLFLWFTQSLAMLAVIKHHSKTKHEGFSIKAGLTEKKIPHQTRGSIG